MHSVRAVPRDDLAVVGEVASSDGRPLHAHLSEQPGENLACEGFYGCSPTALLAEEGLLGPRTTLVHATHLSDDDIEVLGTARATACFCPTTERDLADGIGPARRLHDAGARALPGLRPARRHRPVRGGARRRDARTARDPRARPVRAGRPAGHGEPQRLPVTGLGRRRPDRRRPPRRPGRGAARQPAHGRLCAQPGALRGDVGRRDRRRGGRASTWCATGSTGWAMSVASCATPSRRCASDTRNRKWHNGIRCRARHRHP